MVLAPVTELRRVAHNLKNGRHGMKARIDSGDEFEELAESINEMTVEIIKGHTLIIKSLASALEYRDPYTRGHVDRVSHYAKLVAAQMGLDDEMVAKAETAAILHDIGKIGIADSILKKDGPLDKDERREMDTHAEKGSRMLPSQCLSFALPAILHHHERWDGKGYPWQLAGKKIPVVARILSVVDAFDAMTTDRPYRKGLAIQEAIAEIAKGSGSHFDPEVADAFMIVIKKHGAIKRETP
jgi:HD-GYP domain-containing protein (c-di-GMP phosphodiesterase class II)